MDYCLDMDLTKQGRRVYNDPDRIDNKFLPKGALYKAFDLNEVGYN